jgi:hypothetical protein
MMSALFLGMLEGDTSFAGPFSNSAPKSNLGVFEGCPEDMSPAHCVLTMTQAAG